MTAITTPTIVPTNEPPPLPLPAEADEFEPGNCEGMTELDCKVVLDCEVELDCEALEVAEGGPLMVGGVTSPSELKRSGRFTWLNSVTHGA